MLNEVLLFALFALVVVPSVFMGIQYVMKKYLSKNVNAFLEKILKYFIYMIFALVFMLSAYYSCQPKKYHGDEYDATEHIR